MTDSRSDTTRLTTAWYVYEFLRELILIYPVYAIMFEEVGVGPLELSALLVVWSITAMVTEVPSGTVADLFSRPVVIAVGLSIKASCFVVWCFRPSYPGFVVGFVLWGIGGSLRSGASEALLHDKLLELGIAERFGAVYGVAQAWATFGALVAMVLGGWASQTGYTWPLLLSALAPLAAGLVLLVAVRETGQRRESEGDGTFAGTLASGVRATFRSRALRLPMLLLCLGVVAYDAGEEYFGLVLRERGLDLVAIGWLSALLLLAYLGGSAVAARPTMKRLPASGALVLSGAVLLGGTHFGSTSLLLASLALFAACTAAAKVRLQASLQRGIAGEARATVTSVVALGQELTSLAIFLGLGAVAAATSWVVGFFWLAIYLIVASVMVPVLLGRHTFSP